ncbi:unnamed protein product [Peniophora sp. CBMAI 1063]|nr:unnamed protein product [Peniophora sp. CBMAI 1063]
MSMFYLQPDASQSIMGFPQRSAVYPRAPAASFSTSALRHRPTFPTPLSQEYRPFSRSSGSGVAGRKVGPESPLPDATAGTRIEQITRPRALASLQNPDTH